MQYVGRLVSDTMSIIARCGVLLILYWYVFQLNGGVVNGITYVVAAWSMFLYFAFSVLNLRSISRLIMQDVQSGNVELLFNKPVSYFTYRVWWQVGAGLYPFLIVSIFGTAILALIIGLPLPALTSLFLFSVLPVFIGASFLTLIVYSLVGFLAFWIEDVNPIFWIVDKGVMILGGSYLPVALMPALMYKLALYSPFGASQLLTHTVYNSWQSEWLLAIGIQVFWILVLGLILYKMYGRARKKLSVNGG